MTLDEMAVAISEGLPCWQQKANREWLEDVHGTLTLGGKWICPNLGAVYTKTVDGFELEKQCETEC